MPDLSTEITQIDQVISPERIEAIENKKRIRAEAHPVIVSKLNKFHFNPNNIEFNRMVSGLIFEEWAIREILSQSPETKTQTKYREIVEIAFKQAGLLLGTYKLPSIPDCVKVVFNQNGEPEIIEIVDIKLSKKAYDQDLAQPQKTLNTMDNVISLINLIISGKEISQLPPSEKINSKNKQRRNALLVSLKNKIKGSGLTRQITFASHLSYVTYLSQESKDQKIVLHQDLHNNQGHVDHKIEISQFSRKEVHEEIDHYAETP